MYQSSRPYITKKGLEIKALIDEAVSNQESNILDALKYELSFRKKMNPTFKQKMLDKIETSPRAT